ncbi:MAG: hypothetical protein NZ519_13535 [Bacteroidia bacterium]|nr:hypothetical protein [Bacteroidia bacterium]
MKYPPNLREEELKIRVAQDYFPNFDYANVIGNIDFCVALPQERAPLFEQTFLLWAEAKRGSVDLYKAIVQLILTIGKARTFKDHLPPAFLGAFDCRQITFLPYADIQSIFYQNDFNWNVAPSNHETKEFKLLSEKVKTIIDQKALLFDFLRDDTELRSFIKQNFLFTLAGITKTRIDKNNFITIYNKWLQSVKPTIAVDWERAKRHGIIDADFYLADLLSTDNQTIKDNLYVVLQKDHYELDRRLDDIGLFTSSKSFFKDKQVAHTRFWNRYERPPAQEYWDYIVTRRDLLVPQDIRERKGSFFTPQVWVELSQAYLAEVFGVDWQDEYYVWDCAAGTGNLLAGLVNRDRIFASTLDRQDVDVMRDRIANGANLWQAHVFQFDFLNDEFLPRSRGGKLPDSLYEILTDETKRKRLIIYINPPYAEATTARTITQTGRNKVGVAKNYRYNQRLKDKIGSAANEVFALFMARVYEEIPNCILALFSKMKFIQGTNFIKFREYFLAKFLRGFIVRANSFDNVQGNFPIGFTIWDLSQKQRIQRIECDIAEPNEPITQKKVFYGDLPASLNKWIIQYDYRDGDSAGVVGFMGICGPDFQNNKFLHISNSKGIRHVTYYGFVGKNILQGCIYFAVRHCIKATWLNDRDQFLYPKGGWYEDVEFQNDCLAFTLFHGQNRISTRHGANHWIPFREEEVHCKNKFESHFMTDFIAGKIRYEGNGRLLDTERERTTPLMFSLEAQAVFEAGKQVWILYHDTLNQLPTWQRAECSHNASLYDIREFFQGRNEKGRMRSTSEDERYNKLIEVLRQRLEALAQKIAPKVYEYGFLRR